MPQTDWFSQNAPPSPPPSASGDWFSDNAPNQEGAVSRYLTHATGLPIADIVAHPGDYLNPFSKGYQQKGKEQNSQPLQPVTLRDMLPFGQTSKDVSEGNFAGALGDITPGVIAAAQIGAPLAGKALEAPMGQSIIRKAVPAVAGAAGAKLGSIVGEPITGAAAGAYLGKQVSPVVARSFARLGAQLQKFGLSMTPQEVEAFHKALPSGPIELPGEVQAATPTPFSATSRAQRLGLLLPENTPSSQAIPLSESSLPAEVQQRYPGGLQSRPQSRAEVVDDKAVEDAMRNDLNKHGWNALSEEKQMYYANNAPQFTKRQLIAQEQVRALMEQAQSQAQNILEQARIAAETPKRFTKTVIPKAKVSAPAPSQPVTQGLDVNQDLTDILQRSLDAINTKKNSESALAQSPTSGSNGTDMRPEGPSNKLSTMDDVVQLLRNNADKQLYVRSSSGPKYDIAQGRSFDYQNRVTHAGLSAVPVDPAWLDEHPGYLLRRLTEYADRPPIKGVSQKLWIYEGAKNGVDSDGYDTMSINRTLGYLDPKLVADAARVYAENQIASDTQRLTQIQDPAARQITEDSIKRMRAKLAQMPAANTKPAARTLSDNH